MGFTPEASAKLQDKWISIAKSKLTPYDQRGYLKEYIEKAKPFFIPAGDWKMGILHYGEGEKREPQFTFTVNGSWCILDHRKPDELQWSSVTDERVGETVTQKRLSLSDKLDLKPEETILSIIKGSAEVVSYAGHDPKVDPGDPNSLYFINTGQIYKLDIRGVEDRSTRPQPAEQLKIDDPKEIDFDPNGNFIIIRNGKDQLHIIEKETGDVVKSFEGVKGPFIVDGQGDILYTDTNNQLREIQTNFQAIAPGGTEEAQKRHEQALQSLQDRYSQLDLDQVKPPTSRQKNTEETVAQTLRETVGRQITPKIESANDPEALQIILDTLQAVRNDPANEGYEAVIDEFSTKTRDKLGHLQLAELESQLGDYANLLDDIKGVADTIGLDEKLSKLLELRQKTTIENIDKRREIEQRIQALSGKRSEIIEKYQGELLSTIGESFENIKQLVSESGSMDELNSFSTTLSGQQFEQMLSNIHDPRKRKVWRGQYNQIREAQRGQLLEREQAFDQEQRQRWAQVVQESREDLEGIREEIAKLRASQEIERFLRNPLVVTFRQRLLALPPEIREQEEKRLDIMLGSRKQDIEHRKQLGTVGEKGELKFGKSHFAVYKEPPRLWQSKFEPIGKNAIWSRLVFIDDHGQRFDPDPENGVLVRPDSADEKTKAYIDEYRAKAENYFKSLKRDVPEFNEHWVIPKYYEERLEELSEILNLQADNHRGIAILAGEAGTGKNVLIDILASLSNREVVTIACNKNTAKEDLTFEFYYDPEKGTYKIPSKLVEAIQKPGTIVIFDEINTLPPGVVKMLNATFDYRRTMFINEGGQEKRIDVDPSVLFVGTMNPQNYQGVAPLSPEVKSRARIIDVEYPPFEENRGGRQVYNSDEALILSRYMDGLNDLKPKEFEAAWHLLINRETNGSAEAIIGSDTRIEQNIRRIYDVLRVASRLRKWYQSYQTAESNEPMDFPISLREVTDIAMEMNNKSGTKDIVKRVILPKIDDRAQRKMVDSTIDQVLT